MDKQSTEYFEQKLADYKDMVIRRQGECEQIGKLLGEEARNLTRKGKRFKLIMYIVGAIVAAKAAFELAMLNIGLPSWVMISVSILFLILGIVIVVVSKLQDDSKYEETAGKLRELASMCNSYDRQFMSDYKEYVDRRNPEMTLANLNQLIDLQEKSLKDIREKSDDLAVDLSSVDISYRIDGG